MAIYQEDIVSMDLERAGFHRSFMQHSIGKDDTKANRIGVRLFRGGEPVNLNEATCEGFFHSPVGENILISGVYAQAYDNVAFVDLPQACYNYEGPFTLAIKVIGGGITGTVRMVDGQIVNTFADGTVAPTGSVPTYQEIIALYDQMLEALEGSVKYDIQQELTAAEQAQARENIDGAQDIGLYIDAQGYICQRISSDT